MGDTPGHSQRRTASPVSGRAARRRPRRIALRDRDVVRLQCHNLELDILNLRQEIAALQTTRRILYARVLHRPDDSNGHGSFEQTVREFFALSRHGYYDVVWKSHGETAPPEPIDMTQFMRANFSETLAIGTDAVPAPGGVDSFLVLLDQMMSMLDAPNVTVVQVRVRPDQRRHHTRVIATTACHSPLTAVLLDATCPSLREVSPWLRHKLIGQTLRPVSECHFTFDTRTHRVVGVDFRVDYTATIVTLAETEEERLLLSPSP